MLVWKIVHAAGNRKEDNSIQAKTIREMMRNHQCIYNTKHTPLKSEYGIYNTIQYIHL